MGLGATATTVLAGGHADLYASTDGGATFAAVPDLAVSDVHAVGAAGGRVYLGSRPGVGRRRRDVQPGRHGATAVHGVDLGRSR